MLFYSVVGYVLRILCNSKQDVFLCWRETMSRFSVDSCSLSDYKLREARCIVIFTSLRYVPI